MLDIIKATEDVRYSSVLQEVIRELGGIEILRLTFGPEEVDIDVLLENGKVFSYQYTSTDCKWWYLIEEKFVRDDMLEESVCYVSLEHYQRSSDYKQRMSRFGWEPLAYA